MENSIEGPKITRRVNVARGKRRWPLFCMRQRERKKLLNFKEKIVNFSQTLVENSLKTIQAIITPDSNRKIEKKVAIEQARELLKKVNLSKFENSYPHQLSGGMKMRVAIARCLALKSKIILMDEPFAALDEITRQKMQEELLDLWKESPFTMLFVTHSIDEALKLGSRVIVLSANPGRVVKEMVLDNSVSSEYISNIMFENQPEYFI